MTVPFLDLKAQFEAIKHEVLPALLSVVESQRFILGEPVTRIEEEIAAMSCTRFGIGCASGTDALFLALKTLDLVPGDEVITTPFTFFATAGAIVNAGGRPVFVDIEPASFNIDVSRLEAAITERTRAIVPVHLFGQMAVMERIMSLASRYGLTVIEDAAQAIGARRRIDDEWRPAGSIGAMGTLSFFPSKNLGGWGDGGMVITSDHAMAERVRRLRTHGGRKNYHHDEVGVNSRLDAVQAAVLLAKRSHLQDWNAARRAHAAAYSESFHDVDGIEPPVTDAANEHVFHQYTVRARERDGLLEHLRKREIGAAVYYPIPLHEQPCFSNLAYRAGAFPEAERAGREVLSLPIYPELDARQWDAVVAAVQEFYA